MTSRPVAPPRGARGRPGPGPDAPGSLAAVFDPRRNLLTPMRLGLALVVALTHAAQLGTGHQWHVGRSTLGDLAVDGFFVVSGFLVTGSLLRLGSPLRFAWHRALRVLPGFWVCLLLTSLVLAPLVAVLEGRPVSASFTVGDGSALHYVVRNAGLLVRQFGIDGLLTDVPMPYVLNGSLWTLFYEALCYAGLAALAVAGLARSPRTLLVVLGGTVVVLWALTAGQATGLLTVGTERLLRFGLLFGLGALAWAAARHVPVRGPAARVAVPASIVAVVAGLLLLPDYRALAAPAFAYLCLWVVVASAPPRWLREDWSYGLYVYHWPVLQVLVAGRVAGLGLVPLAVLGIGVSLALAALSWRFVERPALSLKDLWSGRDPDGR